MAFAMTRPIQFCATTTEAIAATLTQIMVIVWFAFVLNNLELHLQALMEIIPTTVLPVAITFRKNFSLLCIGYYAFS